MFKKGQELIHDIQKILITTISETNGMSLNDTLELLLHSQGLKEQPVMQKLFIEFKRLLADFQQDEIDIETIMQHPVSDAFFCFFKNFPLHFYEEHIHLTGSLSADFIYPRLKRLLQGPNKKVYQEKIIEVYGEKALPIKSVDDVDKLIRLKEGELFRDYLRILYLPKLVLTSRKAHKDAAYHMARELYINYNVGHIRLKFTLSRANKLEAEQIPGIENVTEEDVVLGLYEGFKQFQKEYPPFNFILSPCFRKEADFYDYQNYKSKKEHFDVQVDTILELLDQHPELRDHLLEVDTVGDERELYRKTHFEEMKQGLRRLQNHGLRIRSHHGETWKTLRTGVQAVDNAMNIWRVDTLEHGISLGINPNFYFHRLYQKIIEQNQEGHAIDKNSKEYAELMDMSWNHPQVRDKLLKGKPLNELESTQFIKAKFHNASEIEHYQHDVLNRLINKKVSLVSLPSSNLKLTGMFPDYKDHPFSWWENKGVLLGVGTDNYITLNTNYIKELLILLYSNPESLKITKLLMVATKEGRRSYIAHLLWKMRQEAVTPDEVA